MDGSPDGSTVDVFVSGEFEETTALREVFKAPFRK